MVKVRVVPDVNIYISGLLWTGLPHRLIQAAEIGTLGLVTTPSILEETQEVLARPKFSARMSTLQISVGELLESLLSIVETIRMATPQQFWKRWGKRLVEEEPQ